MEKKHKPQRICAVCRQRKNKEELIRIVKAQSGEITLDKTGKADGRGAYVCNDTGCIEKTCKKKLLNRSLKCNVPQEVYGALAEMGNDGGE